MASCCIMRIGNSTSQYSNELLWFTESRVRAQKCTLHGPPVRQEGTQEGTGVVEHTAQSVIAEHAVDQIFGSEQ